MSGEFTTVLQQNFDLFEKKTLEDLGLTTIEQVFGGQREISYSNPCHGFFRVLSTLKTTVQLYLNHPIFNRIHESVLLPYQESSIEIDWTIAQLIEEIWKAQIQTTGCCEDVASLAGYIWINFKTSEDFKKFMEIIYVGQQIEQSVTNLQLWSVKTNFILRHLGEDSIH